MHNDSSVRHIAVTCPHCGKHYKKVPYEAIKKFKFAFCKQCNAKFHIPASALEEALQRALQDAQHEPGNTAAANAGAAAFTGREHSEPSPVCDPPGREDLAAAQTAEPAETAPDGQPEPEAFPQAAACISPAPAGQGVSLEQALEQKITDLAATMEATFCRPATPAASVLAPADSEETLQDAHAEAAQATLSAHSETEDNWQHSTPESDTPEDETMAEFEIPAETGLESPGSQDALEADLFEHGLPENPHTAAAQAQAAEATEPRPAEPGSDTAEDQPEPAELLAPFTFKYPGASEDAAQSAEEDFSAGITREELTLPAPDGPAEDKQAFSPQEPEPQQAEDLPEDIFAATLPPAGRREPLAPKAGEDPAAAAQAFSRGLPEEVFPKEESRSPDLSLPDDRHKDPADEELPEHSGDPAPDAAFADGESPGTLSGTDPPFAASAQESFEEEFLDEDLIEEPEAFEELFAQEPPDQSGVQEHSGHSGFRAAAASGPQPDDSLFDSLQDIDGNRDVAAMLKQLALPADALEEGMEQFVLFSLGAQTFAVPIANVFELSLPPELIAVPNTPAWILGVCNMRGEIISVVDFKDFLNIEPGSFKKPSRMIIAQTLDKQMIIGLVVDRIKGIKYFSVDAIQPPRQQAPGMAATFSRGACPHEAEEVIFFDLEQILQSSKMRQFQ